MRITDWLPHILKSSLLAVGMFLSATLPATSAFAQPDLAVTNFAVGLGASGQPVSLDYTISNLGDAGITGIPFVLKVFADLESPPDAATSGNNVAASILLAVDLGPNDSVSGSILIPDGILCTGYHLLWLMVDGDNRIAESVETNNTAGGLTFIDGYPSMSPDSGPERIGTLLDVVDISSKAEFVW